jgi:hypothetical protein
MSVFALQPTIAQLAAEQSCARLIAAFAFFVDHQRYDELVNLFTEDCVFDRDGVVLRGREELRTFMQERPKGSVSRHVCAPPVLEDVGANTIRGTTCLTYFISEPVDKGPARFKGIGVVAEYRDEFRHTYEGWRIASRCVVQVMRQG